MDKFINGVEKIGVKGKDFEKLMNLGKALQETSFKEGAAAQRNIDKEESKQADKVEKKPMSTLELARSKRLIK